MNESVAHSEIPIASERSFAVVFTVAFTAIGLHPLLGDGAIRGWAIFVAAAVLAFGLFLPRVLSVPNRLWHHLGLALGTVVSQVLMVALFFLVLTPSGFAMRLFGKVPSEHERTPDPKKSTYWIPRWPDDNPMGSLRNQY